MIDPSFVTIESLPDHVLVRVVADKLDDERLRQLTAQIHSTVAASGDLPMVLDLAGVGFMSSVAIATLICMASDFRDRQRRLMLAGLNLHLQEIIQKTKLNNLFELHHDVDAAHAR